MKYLIDFTALALLYAFIFYTPMNLVPFIDVSLGFLFPLTQKRTAKFCRTVFFCFLMSLGIEILQPIINGSRPSDVTDLITNVIGGILGYGFYVVFKPIIFWILNHLKTTT